MLIGSRALAIHNTSFKCREDSDWDFIGEQTVPVPEGARIEIHPLDELNNREALLFEEEGVCSILGLAMLKRSHLWRDRDFDKNIATYHKHILPHCPVKPSKERFLVCRTALTKQAYPQGVPTLAQTNEEFFNDAVTKVYDHDYLHTLYAYGDSPLYESLKKPTQMEQAWCEKDLWLDLTDEQRNMCVAEECYVIATERFLVPNDWGYSSKRAYFNALQKVCTTLTSGWFRDWAIDHYPEVLYLYEADKFNRVKDAIGE